jgi:hypothetical protein
VFNLPHANETSIGLGGDREKLRPGSSIFSQEGRRNNKCYALGAGGIGRGLIKR